MTQEQAWELMRRAGALEKGHFLMKSGRHADLFLQCAHLAEHADITGELCRALAERCRDCGCDLVMAPALGGLIFDQFTTIPQDGTHPEVDAAGLHIRVERLTDHRVEEALVSKLAPAEDPGQEGEEKENAGAERE